MANKTTTRANEWAWRCQDCGRKFKTAAAAERASYSDRGCPGCGSSDIDMSLPVRREQAGVAR